MPFSIIDRLVIPKLVVCTAGAGRPEEVIGLRPLPHDDQGYPIPHPTQISLMLHFQMTDRPTTIMFDADVEDEDLDERLRLEREFIHGAFLGYSLHWQGNSGRPLFDLNVFRPALGEHFPRWYQKAIGELSQYINGCLLADGEGWRLGDIETCVPKPLGGFHVNEPVPETPLELAYRHMQSKRTRPTQLELWETTPWLYVAPKTSYEPCVILK